MEIPNEVLLHNTIIGLKGSPGVLIRVSTDGYYEVNVLFGERTHRMLLPIDNTVVIQREAEVAQAPDFEVER